MAKIKKDAEKPKYKGGMTGLTHTDETKQKIREKMLNSLNAEYWTAEIVESTLFEMIEYLNTDIEEDVSVSEELSAIRFGEDKNEDEQDKAKQVRYTVKKIKTRPHLKKDARLHLGIYNPNWFSQMADKFADNETISCLLGCIDDICETNTYNSASKGMTNSIMAKANLAKHYDWKDKVESDNTNRVQDVVVKLPEPDEEAKRRWEKSQLKDE